MEIVNEIAVTKYGDWQGTVKRSKKDLGNGATDLTITYIDKTFNSEDSWRNFKDRNDLMEDQSLQFKKYTLQ